jgi:hypothetical protein
LASELGGSWALGAAAIGGEPQMGVADTVYAPYQDHYMACLARWFLRADIDYETRRRLWQNWSRTKGEEFMAELKRRIQEERRGNQT